MLFRSFSRITHIGCVDGNFLDCDDNRGGVDGRTPCSADNKNPVIFYDKTKIDTDALLEKPFYKFRFTICQATHISCQCCAGNQKEIPELKKTEDNEFAKNTSYKTEGHHGPNDDNVKIRGAALYIRHPRIFRKDMFRAPNTDTDCSELPRPTHICTPDTQPERKPMVLDHVPGQWESFIIDKSKQTNVFMPGDIINNNTELELQDLKTVKHNDTHVQIQWDCQSHKAFICNTPIDQPRPGTQSCCVACSPGTIRKNGACVACPAGRFMENIDIQRDNHKTYVFTHQIEIVKNNESIQCDNGSCEPLCDQLSCNCNGLKCNITECMKCPSGKYQDLPQQARCKFCESNTFQPNEGAEDCELCPPGSYSYFSVSRKGEPIEQKNYCTIKETTCPNNQVFARAANMCVDRNLCPPGSIFDDNTRSCVECTTPGTFAALDNTCASISEVCECTSACQSTTLKRGFEFKGIYNAISKTCEPDCISIGATVYNYTIRSCQCKNGQGISRGNCNTCQIGRAHV